MDKTINIESPVSWLIFVVMVLVYTLPYVVLFYRRWTRRQLQLRVFRALNTGLYHSLTTDLSDVVNLYKGFYGLGSDDQSYHGGLASTLRGYLVFLQETADRTDPEEARRCKKQITAFLNELDKSAPYANLPETERAILTDMERFINQKDETSALRKIGELASVIEVREGDYSKTKAYNRWSVPLAVLGLLSTIFFGIYSLTRY